VSLGTQLPHSTYTREIEMSLSPLLIYPSTYIGVLIKKKERTKIASAEIGSNNDKIGERN
jgi:hypothetical protein